MHDLGALIRDRRAASGLSQEELARRVGVTRQAVSHWENGRNLPRPDELRALATALQTPLAILAGIQQIEPVQQISAPPSGPVATVFEPLVTWTVGGYTMTSSDQSISLPVDVPQSVIAVRVGDNSMMPDLHAGDVVILAPTETPADDDIVMIARRNETPSQAVFRYYRSRPDKSTFDLLPLAATAPAETVGPGSNVQILGVVIEVRHRPRLRRQMR